MNQRPENKEEIRAAMATIDKQHLAEALGVKVGVIRQITGGHLMVSPERAREIERILKQPGLARVLRPDVFDYTPEEVRTMALKSIDARDADDMAEARGRKASGKDKQKPKKKAPQERKNAGRRAGEKEAG